MQQSLDMSLGSQIKIEMPIHQLMDGTVFHIFLKDHARISGKWRHLRW